MSPAVRLALPALLAALFAAVAARAGSLPAPAPDLPPVAATSPHFALRHGRQVGPAQAVATLATLEEGLSSIGGELGLRLDAPLEVLLLEPSSFRALTGCGAWVRGTYDGRILLAVGEETAAAGANGAAALRPLLLHELTHALLRRALAPPLPPWLEEGLAERAEGNTPEAAAAWLRDRRAPAFAGLDAVDADIRAGGWREDAGHQRARLALQALVACAGAGAPARLVAALRAGRTPAQALDAVVPGGAAACDARLRAGSP